MPCDSVITIRHDVSKWNGERALQAIKEAGLMGIVRYYNGQLIVASTSKQQDADRVTAVTKKYSELTIKAAAKRFGWNVKAQTVTKTGLTQLHLGRR